MDWVSALRNLFGGGGAGGGGFSSLEDPSGYTTAPTPAPRTIDWMGGFKDLAKEIAPGLGMAAAGAGLQALMPGTPARVIGVDPRTETGGAAEAARLGAAQRATGQLEGSFTSPYGALTPEEIAAIKKQVRSASAATGKLETGGHAKRETEAIQEANRAKQQQLYGNVAQLTSGFQPRGVVSTPGAANPWANILTQALAPSIGKGFGALINKWWV